MHKIAKRQKDKMTGFVNQEIRAINQMPDIRSNQAREKISETTKKTKDSPNGHRLHRNHHIYIVRHTSLDQKESPRQSRVIDAGYRVKGED